MRLFAGRRVGPLYVGASVPFHPARILHHMDEPVPSALAWLILGCAGIMLWVVLRCFWT